MHCTSHGACCTKLLGRVRVGADVMRLELTAGWGLQSELGAWLRDGTAPWDTPADI